MPSSVRNLRYFGSSALILLLGGFLAGLIIPHENGFAISLVEKLEDLVSLLLLPLVSILSLYYLVGADKLCSTSLSQD